MTERRKKIEGSRITFSQMRDGRFVAQFWCEGHPFNSISQFGKTEFEAKINLQALLNVIRRKQLERGGIFIGSVNVS